MSRLGDTSIHSARENSADRAAQTLARLDEKAGRLNELLAQAAGTMRATNAALAAAPDDPRICGVALGRLATLQPIRGRYALYRLDGRMRCATACPSHIDRGSAVASAGSKTRPAPLSSSGSRHRWR